MKFWPVLFLGVLILGAFSYSPSLVEHMVSRVVISGEVVVHGSVSQVSLNLTVPQNTSNQVVECDTPLVKVGDNWMAHLEFPNPSGTMEYNVTCLVDTRYQEVSDLPRAYDISPYKNYTLPSEGVPSDDPQMRALAEKIVKGANTDFEKMARLTKWVNHYIEYDPSMVGKYLDAYEILKERRGVCVEYSTLFATLARSLGYPTRFVGGLAEGEHGITGHMWVEVYLGRWVPFDPTWGLGGSMDATHIPFYKSRERIVESKIFYVSHGGNVNWVVKSSSGKGFFNSGMGDLFVIKKEVMSPPVLGKPIVPAKTLGFGVSSMVFLNVSSSLFLISPITLATCTGPQEVVHVYDPEKMVILEPGKPVTQGWKIETNALNPNYIYTCPLTFNSPFMPAEEADVTVKKSRPLSFSVELSEKNATIGDEIYVYIDSAENARVYILFGDRLISTDGGHTVVKLKADTLGNIPLYVAPSSGGLFEAQIQVKAPDTVGISRVLIGDKALVGEDVPLKVLLRNPTGKSIPVQVTIDYPAGELKKVVDLGDTGIVNFSLVFQSPGFKEVTVRVSGPGITDERNVIVQVMERPDITVSSQEINGQVLRLVFNVVGDPENASITVDGQVFQFSREFSVQLPPGFHVIRVSWEDYEGNRYSKEIRVTVKGESLDIFILIFIIALALAVILVIIALVLIWRGIKTKAQ